MNSQLQQYSMSQPGNYPSQQSKKLNNLIGILFLITACCIFFFLGQAFSGIAQAAFNTIHDQPEVAISQEITGPSDFREAEKAFAAPENRINDWKLLLVNPWNKVPPNYEIPLASIKGGQIDERILPDLQEMMDDCRAEGLNPIICSAYRTMEKQTQLYNNKVEYYLAGGYTQEEAEAEAGKWVALPGTSEHQLGLAIDVISESNQLLDETQEGNPVQQWFMENSYKYGFILRYPSDKSDITGIAYEPWHYRYVGRDAAADITEQGICLEEYLENR